VPTKVPTEFENITNTLKFRFGAFSFPVWSVFVGTTPSSLHWCRKSCRKSAGGVTGEA